MWSPLKPFYGQLQAPVISYHVDCTPQTQQIEVGYQVKGAWDLPTQLPQLGQRVDGLWESTCFEVFLGQELSPSYYEVNCSPNGDWNVFLLDAYRKGKKETDDIEVLGLRIEAQHNLWTLWMTLGVRQGAYRLGVATVWDQPRNYFCLHHMGEKPDFHNPLSFDIPVYI